jgi:hypothetical protein
MPKGPIPWPEEVGILGLAELLNRAAKEVLDRGGGLPGSNSSSSACRQPSRTTNTPNLEHCLRSAHLSGGGQHFASRRCTPLAMPTSTRQGSRIHQHTNENNIASILLQLVPDLSILRHGVSDARQGQSTKHLLRTACRRGHTSSVSSLEHVQLSGRFEDALFFLVQSPFERWAAQQSAFMLLSRQL